MSNYTPSTDFAAKDSLLSGNPNKIVKGTEITAELTSIAAAVATKADSSSSNAFQAGATTLGATTATSLNSTPIGNSAPSTGAFTTLSATGNASLAGNGTSARYVALLSETNTYAGSFNLQAGGGSAGWGGGLIMYGHSHATKPGDVVAGVSASSGGKFRVNSWGVDGGTDWLVSSSTGLAVTGALSATGGITNTAASGNPTLTLSGSGSYTSVVTLNGGGGGSGYITSGSGASLRLNAPTGQTVTTEINNTTVTNTSSAGLAVTGALSATGSFALNNGNPAYWGGAGSDTYINGSASTDVVEIVTGAAQRVLVNNTGLAVTGALSATGANLVTGQLSSNQTSTGVTDFSTGSNAMRWLSFGTGTNGSYLWYQGKDNTPATLSMTLDTAGNLGLGVTPSAWNGGIKAIELTAGALFSANDTTLLNNGYINGAGSFIYKATVGASRYAQYNGAHSWYTAPSGTAGNAITFTQAMTLTGGSTTELKLFSDTSGTGASDGLSLILGGLDAYLYNRENGPLLFGTNNTERFRIDSSGTIVLADTNSAGIRFPATQVAVANANTLDDYEEGTWTPTQGAGLTVVGAFSSSGTYTKVGRQVTIQGSVSGATSVAAATNAIICSGLPFACTSSNFIGSASNAALSVPTNVWVNQSTSSLYAVGAQSASSQITFTATYFV